MFQRFGLVLLSMVCLRAYGQQLDSVLYLRLARADSSQFLTEAKNAGFAVKEDTAVQALLASRKGLLFAKPLKDAGTAYYNLSLVISTASVYDRDNLLKRLRAIPGQKHTWTDDSFVYVEVDMDDPATHQSLYKFLMYKIAVVSGKMPNR